MKCKTKDCDETSWNPVTGECPMCVTKRLDAIIADQRERMIQAKLALDYSIKDQPDKVVDKIVWEANMEATKLLQVG